jgi:hypothetical protein
MWRRVTQACLLVLAMTTAPEVAAQPAPAAIPDNLKVPEQNVLLFEAYAVGVQIYVCAPKADDPNAFAWTLKAPEAELRNDDGEKIGKHYAGPSWEANDGSKVVGAAMESAKAPTADAIPWLLLKAKTHDGSGALSTVTYVQRLDTVGGAAPTDGCDRSAADAEHRVDYTATYAFYYGAAQ